MEHEPTETSQSALVLIVERDPHIQQLERYFLEQAGFHVEFSHDGEHGLLKAQELRPRILISEILLPRIDGLSICRRIKGDPATQSIRVLLFSILSAAERAYAAGADAFLQKPLNDIELISVVQRLLNLSRNDNGGTPAP